MSTPEDLRQDAKEEARTEDLIRLGEIVWCQVCEEWVLTAKHPEDTHNGIICGIVYALEWWQRK
jgi:hypothetical protein